MCLLPGYTHYRIVVVRRVPEIVFNIWFVVSKFFPPYQGIGECFIDDG
jgi:hypothetical protein